LGFRVKAKWKLPQVVVEDACADAELVPQGHRAYPARVADGLDDHAPDLASQKPEELPLVDAFLSHNLPTNPAPSLYKKRRVLTSFT
jgi:hypothetical protein